MRLALLLCQYRPHGGLQREVRRWVAELAQRGHQCRVYCCDWQGEALAGAELRSVPVAGFSQQRRNQRFVDWVQTDLSRDPVDGILGFNRMPGLDICFAADACYLDTTLPKQNWLSRRGARQGADWERAVFAADSKTHVLLLSDAQRDAYAQHYATPASRLHVLPPGVAPERRAPADEATRRKSLRASLKLESQELTLLFVASDFVSKGLDRVISAFAQMRKTQPSVKSRLLVVGQDKSRSFQRLGKRLGVAAGLTFLGGREDVADLMLAADLLVHPARHEPAGLVLLEALAAGLPVVATDVCGYAPHVKAARAGILLDAPFSQAQLDRAVLRCIDGIYRAECRRSALQYARLTDLYSMHRVAADLVEKLIGPRRETE